MAIVASNNPFPCDPNSESQDKLDRGGYVGTAKDLDDKIKTLQFPDNFLAIGEITKTDAVISIAALAFKWRINQNVYDLNDVFSTVIAPATPGYNRIDIIVATKFSSFVKIQGAESLSSAKEPQTPSGTLRVTFISVFGSQVSEPEYPSLSEYATVKSVESLERSLKISAKIYENGELQIFRKPGTPRNPNNPDPNIGDWCIGFVEGSFINAEFLGPNKLLLTSYNL